MVATKRNIVIWLFAILTAVSCTPKVSFDVDSFQKSLEEIASGVIEWTSDLEEGHEDTLNVGDKF